MRGLIYKEFTVFYKSIEKKLLIIAAAAIALLIYKTGIYGGLMASIMLAVTIGMQNIMSFASDDKARWRKYQLAMPVSSFSAVASKYISVVCTLGFSLLGSLFCSLLSSVIYGSFDLTIWGLAIFTAIFIPLLWTGICLPLTYWFGVQSAQALGLVIFLPMIYLVKFFEDGAGLSAMAASLSSYLLFFAVIAVAVFGLSIVISTMGYARKR